MPYVDARDARIHFEVFGSGTPTTLFAHGLGVTGEDVRPLASGVQGRRAFFDFRGHGLTELTGEARWDYEALAADLAAVSDAVGATRCAGVSMGAGALMRLLAVRPDRFERGVFFTPAAVDARRDSAAVRRWDRLAALVENGDVEAIAADLAAALPGELRRTPAVLDQLRRRARAMITAGSSAALRRVPREAPVGDVAALVRVTARALVIAEDDDAMHPVSVARALAQALPDARLHLLAPGGLWTDRLVVRQLVGGFLNGEGRAA
jgi:3-oxoadipate enol-lactonase